ncbi:hypothetical protein CCR75_004816 [Bremia lactucae]|uniref:Phospholipase A-2-activating protein n=1 Tax=Bremia lactucae TaxID=4779 RepID=A0A976FJ19_BRELC|nr:hypothetical protein CCR75_004816 [Bremia lactucae]
MAKTYDVNCELRGHNGAVRCITSLSNDLVVTGAMDSTVRVWQRDTSSSFVVMESASIYEHEHWITASVALGSGGFATGSMDKHIRLFDAQFQRYGLLQGHDGGVISLAVSYDQKQLLSGSWDGTARVWSLETFECLHIFRGHENGVCVLGLPNGSIVTGSTGQQVGNTIVDFKLRFWDAKTFSLLKTIADHAGPIRQLALVHTIGFLSCSNDGSIKLRTNTGTVLATMVHPRNAEGKPGFVLGICVLPNGLLVSASEDATARVWAQDGALLQTIEHPGGLWCVTSLPNGDFLTGCDDHVVRVFTTQAERMNSIAKRSLETAVKEAQMVKLRGPNGVEIEALSAYEDRGEKPGTSDGQIQMFRRGNTAWACQWSQPSSTWIDIGEVTGTRGEGGVVENEAFDMVIPVEIELPGGLQKLEIGFNQGQNPFTIAQAFIDKHQLSQTYLGEIAEFITQRVKESRPLMLDTEVTDQGPRTLQETNSFQYFPVSGYNTFETTKITKLMSTLRQFNAAMKETQAPEALTDSQLLALDAIIHTVQDTAFYHSSTFGASGITTLIRALEQWPVKYAFPMLDLIRLVLVHPHGPEAIGEARLTCLLSRLLQLGAENGPFELGNSMTTRMLVLRVLANLFLYDKARAVLVAYKTDVLKALPSFLTYPHKLVALSFSTVLLNFARAIWTCKEAFTLADSIVVMSLAADLLNGSYTVEELGNDTLLRLLVTIGTLASCGDDEFKKMAKIHVELFVASKASAVTSKVVQECLLELQQVVD